MLSREELEDGMVQFIGTEHYHKWSLLFRNIVLTDGVKWLADNAECYWLMDLIASYQSFPTVRRNPFQVWKIKVNTSAQAMIVCEDGNNNELAHQFIEFTDMPLAEVDLWVEEGDGYRVILLPNEH